MVAVVILLTHQLFQPEVVDEVQAVDLAVVVSGAVEVLETG
jgi:hypothetical protein